MIAADLYLRLSDGRSENGSFAERETALRRKADYLGWTVHRVVIENDESRGTTRNASAFKRRRWVASDGTVTYRVVRPGFESIMDDLKAGRAQALLAEDLDRVMRDPKDAETLIDVVQAKKANVDSLTGSLKFTDGGTDAEITQARVLVAFAWKSSRDTARRVSAGRARVAAAAQFGGGRRPYGLTPVPHPSGNHRNTSFVLCEPEADEVRRAADQVLAGVPLRGIARDMRQRGVATVTGAAWTSEVLRDVLLRPINAGIIVNKGKETAVRIPGDPILPEDTWRAVVDVLTDPSRSSGPAKAATWLLTNIARCRCGARVDVHAGRGRAPVYRCDPDDPQRAHGPHVRRNARHLDEYVSGLVVARMIGPDAAELLPRQVSPGVDVAELRRQQRALMERKRGLSRMLGAGDIDEGEFAEAKRQNDAKLAKVAEQLAGATSDRSPLSALINVDDVQAAWDRLGLAHRREIVRALMRITILPTTRLGAGFDPTAIEIDWNI